MSLQDIPKETLDLYNKSKLGSRNLSSQVETHLEMCSATQTAVDDCFKANGSKISEATAFPEPCVDLAVNHMECSIAKRENAMKIAEKLAGKAAVEKVFPKYEENKQKALDLIAMYKGNAAGGNLNKDVFWG
ncbi:MAG: hypothetical protein SGBAC_000125 [Bacillariaceae sp.]